MSNGDDRRGLLDTRRNPPRRGLLGEPAPRGLLNTAFDDLDQALAWVGERTRPVLQSLAGAIPFAGEQAAGAVERANAQTLGELVGGGVPVVGDVQDVRDIYRGLVGGDLPLAAMGAAGMVPVVGGVGSGAMKRIFRASNDATGRFWALNRPTAIAYRHNEPFGGPRIFEGTIPDEVRVLDIRGREADFLNETLGDEWKTLYETQAWALEDPAIVRRLSDEGVGAVRFLDDYPDEADVLFVPNGLTGAEIDVNIRQGLAEALEEFPQYRAGGLYEAARDYLANVGVYDAGGDLYDVSDLEPDEIVALIRDGSYKDRFGELRLGRP